jgi:tetratricopeptide (TPR) repeat protein
VFKLGDLELGKKLFQEAVKVTSVISVYYISFNDLKNLEKSSNKLNYPSIDNGIIQKILKKIKKPLIIFTKISEVYMKIMILKKAKKVDEIESPPEFEIVLRSIGESVLKLGDVEFGKIIFPILLEAAQGMNFASLSFAISSIGESVSILGDVELGNNLFPVLLEVARGIKDSNHRSSALSSIGESVVKLGDVELGKNLFQEALEIASGIKESGYRSSAISSIGESVAKLGDVDFGKNLFLKILELGYQLKVSNERKDVIQSIAKATSTFGTTSAYSYFETNHESHPDIPEVVKAYTEKYRKIKWEETSSQELFSYYIRSFGWVPFEGEFAKQGAYDVISTLAKLGKVEEALEAGRGIGMIPEVPSDTFESELAELDRLLAEDEITKKVYQRQVDELKGKYGVS